MGSMQSRTPRSTNKREAREEIKLVDKRHLNASFKHQHSFIGINHHLFQRHCFMIYHIVKLIILTCISTHISDVYLTISSTLGLFDATLEQQVNIHTSIVFLHL